MKIRKKSLTKECKKCDLNIDECCTWGNSTKTKMLVAPLGEKKHCNLIIEGSTKNIENKYSGRG